jgi:hypothetical protein
MVDTGFSQPEIMGNHGMKGWWREGQGVDAQLEKHGLRREDIRYILHIHLHIDHAGYDDQCRMDGTTVVINRRELEYSVSGLMASSIRRLTSSTSSTACTIRARCGCSTSRWSVSRRSFPACAARPRGAHRGLDERTRRDRRGDGVHLR